MKKTFLVFLATSLAMTVFAQKNSNATTLSAPSVAVKNASKAIHTFPNIIITALTNE